MTIDGMDVECAYCDADLRDADSHIDKMDILNDHIWTAHPDLHTEVVTGEISPETYAKIEAQFLTSLSE